ncbi:hypothetical protein EJB05_45915, partial [Eragrostis curvula]
MCPRKGMNAPMVERKNQVQMSSQIGMIYLSKRAHIDPLSTPQSRFRDTSEGWMYQQQTPLSNITTDLNGVATPPEGVLPVQEREELRKAKNRIKMQEYRKRKREEREQAAKVWLHPPHKCSLSHISTIVTYVLRVMADNAVQSGADVTNVVSDAGAQIDQHSSNDGDQIAASEVHPAGVDVVGNHGLYRCNRPKRSDADEVIPPDYICTPDEFAMIEELKSIPFKPTAIVSEINGAFVSRQNFQDLLRPHAYINGDVLSMYIELLREQEHLLSRGGAKIPFGKTRHERKASGLFVLQFMRLWTGERIVFQKLCREAHILRARFFVEMCKLEQNECADNIPEPVKEILDCIRVIWR